MAFKEIKDCKKGYILQWERLQLNKLHGTGNLPSIENTSVSTQGKGRSLQMVQGT